MTELNNLIKNTQLKKSIKSFIQKYNKIETTEKRIVEIKALLFLLYQLPITGIKAEESARGNKIIHFLKSQYYIAVDDIAQRIASTHNTVKFSSVPAGKITEIAALQFNR